MRSAVVSELNVELRVSSDRTCFDVLNLETSTPSKEVINKSQTVIITITTINKIILYANIIR